MHEQFPAEASAFYLARDHRTNLYLENPKDYANRRVVLTAATTALKSHAGQIIAMVTANLLSRWSRAVILAIDNVDFHHRFARTGSLIDYIIQGMRDADPFGDFRVGGIPSDYDLHVHVGSDCPSTKVPTTVLSSQGWYAAVQRRPQDVLAIQESENPVGAAAAAVLGGAQIFRDAIAQGELFGTKLLYDAFLAKPVDSLVVRGREEIETEASIGRLVMIGAGAVGSSAASFMNLFALAASLRVVDGDIVKIENFGRSPIFGRSSFVNPKASVLKSGLGQTRLTIDTADNWWNEAEAMALGGFDVVIPVANEHNVRWEIQANVPPLMIHAATGRNWNALFGRHIPGNDDCLADRFEGIEDKPSFTCSTGRVPIEAEKTVDASLPFLSFFAGLLIAADLSRLSIAGYPHTPNYGNYSFRKNRFTPHLHPYAPRPGCICRDQSEAFWQFRGNSKYAKLSPRSWT
jgi:molybdopterin/thiamine biosynthesis adenylyltransferase